MPAERMPPVELVTVRTSATCISYRLYAPPEGITDAPRLVWSNRAFADVPESRAACEARARRWARAHGYRIVERKEVVKRRA